MREFRSRSSSAWRSGRGRRERASRAGLDIVVFGGGEGMGQKLNGFIYLEAS